MVSRSFPMYYPAQDYGWWQNSQVAKTSHGAQTKASLQIISRFHPRLTGTGRWMVERQPGP